jgi:hypothetical protein
MGWLLCSDSSKIEEVTIDLLLIGRLSWHCSKVKRFWLVCSIKIKHVILLYFLLLVLVLRVLAGLWGAGAHVGRDAATASGCKFGSRLASDLK